MMNKIVGLLAVMLACIGCVVAEDIWPDPDTEGSDIARPVFVMSVSNGSGYVQNVGFAPTDISGLNVYVITGNTKRLIATVPNHFMIGQMNYNTESRQVASTTYPNMFEFDATGVLPGELVVLSDTGSFAWAKTIAL